MGNNPLLNPRLLLKYSARRLEEKQPERKEKHQESMVKEARKENGEGDKKGCNNNGKKKLDLN